MLAAPLVESFIFPGEDRSFGGDSLFVDLVPSSSWAQNARSVLSAAQWKRVSLIVKLRCKGICEACGAPEQAKNKCYIEAHERWNYDLASSTQKLRRLVGLCSRCHRATHFGFAASRGLGKAALKQLERVNGWSPSTAQSHVKQAFSDWEIRSSIRWSVDVSLLAGFQDQKASACIGVCHIHEGRCLGCNRQEKDIFQRVEIPGGNHAV
jgi:hypothetical protein